MKTAPFPGAILVAAGLSASLAVAGPQASAQATGAAVPLETLLERAGAYVLSFEARFANVVTEERYHQEATSISTAPAPVFTGRGALSPQFNASKLTRRDLVSDFLLVKQPGTDQWLPFRDVFEVDRQRIRDREDRLTKLFLNPTGSALDQALRIMDESARYNVGEITRTINLPVFALQVLRPTSQPHFRFTKGKTDTSVGAGVVVVDYREQGSPTMIRGLSGRDVPSRGRLWIDASSGQVLKTELDADDRTVRGMVTTRYQIDPSYGVAVPVDMREDYSSPGGTHVTGLATYGHFRRFTVEVDDALAAPPRSITDAVTGMTLVEVPPGPSGKAFFLGRFEVTQSEWRAVVDTSPSSFAQCGPTCPVESVSLTDARQFLSALNARTREVRYRLPTDAEWERACLAGATTPFSTGDVILTTQANYNGLQTSTSAIPGVFREHPVPIGSFDPNRWGLGDMHGNVGEWTAEGGIRGGSWSSEADALRCRRRESPPSSGRANTIGFRIAADLAAPR